MSEETQDVQTSQVEGEQKQEENQYSDVEQLALEKGWKPKEEYQGDPTRWRTAETFLALEEPLKRIEQQSKELKAVRAALEAFKEHHTKVKETEFNRAVKALQDTRKKAMIEGDAETALALEERIEEVKAEKQAVLDDARKTAVQETTAELHPEFQEWLSRNNWYGTNKAMRVVADRLGLEYHADGLSQREVLKRVEEEIKKEFPHRFQNDKTKRAMAVEPTSRSGKPAGSSSFELDETEREIMRKIVRSGAMTEKEYIAELKRVKQGA